MRHVLVPSYMKNFQCIGSDCEDTCCAGWKVIVDKETFQKYRETKHPLMKELLKKSVSRNRPNTSKDSYAKIQMNEDGACSLLDDEGLCKVQALLGPEMLSNTCAIYPRMLNRVDETVEKSLTLSCPEATRLALLNPNGIDFLEEEEPANTPGFMNRDFQTSPKHSYFWNLRIFTIQLLQDRRRSIETRLIVLGLFFQRIDALSQKEMSEHLSYIMTEYLERLGDDEFLESISQLPSNLSFQVNMGKSLIEYRITDGLTSKRYLDCLQDMISGLSLEEETAMEKVIEKYTNSNEIYYFPYMKEHEYILENYLVNYVFKSLFPNDQPRLFDSYVMLIVNMALIKLHLIGMANTHKGLTTDIVLKLVQSYSKTIDHNASYLVNVRDILKESGYSTMAHMVVLLKS
ncbi:flagellin lysine-N-methylase [Psychrobacillus sp. FSL H8-0483]|uniref:flagellin lysine-N-methylase n=1 Tax=Psychrobacillus sp. FSL H8-0483 TaxID=2921389 RepID=UPI00315A63E8